MDTDASIVRGSSLKRTCDLCGKSAGLKVAFNSKKKVKVPICDECSKELSKQEPLTSSRNKPCQCGSGKKTKLCCGKK